MTDIPSTLIATSNPVDICKGFALFPGLGTARAGISFGGSSNKLVSLAKTRFIAVTLSFDVSVSLTMGVCGPAYGIAFTTEGSYTPSTLQLSVTDDTTAAGFFYGANFTISFGGTVDVLQLKWISDGWKSRVEESWVTALNLSADTTIDIVGLVLEFLLGKLAQGNNAAKKISNGISNVGGVLPNLLGSYSIYSQETDSLAGNKGTVTLSPSVDLPINIIALLKKIPALGAVITGLENIDFYVSVGPVFSLIIPINVAITGFSVGGALYNTKIQWDAEGNYVAAYTSGAVPTTPRQIAVNLQHKPGTRFEYKLGIFFSLNVMKIFNTGATWSIAVPDLLNLKPNFGTFNNTLSAAVGASSAGFDPLHVPGHEEDFEVVFEPAASA